MRKFSVYAWRLQMALRADKLAMEIEGVLASSTDWVMQIV